MSLLHLTTPRLHLRPLVTTDAADLQRLYRDPEVERFMRPVQISDAEEALSIKRHIEGYYQIHGFGLLAGVLHETGGFVGRYGFLSSTIDGVTELEVSYLTAPEFRGRGLATEAVHALLDGAWAQDYRRVVAVILPTNKLSQRVAENAGLSYERDVTYKEFGRVHLFAASPASL